MHPDEAVPGHKYVKLMARARKKAPRSGQVFRGSVGNLLVATALATGALQAQVADSMQVPVPEYQTYGQARSWTGLTDGAASGSARCWTGRCGEEAECITS